MKRLRLVSLWFLVLLACKPELGPTQIVLRVDTDFAVPAALNEVRFEVKRAGAPEKDKQSVTALLRGADAVPLPLTLALNLREDGDPGPFEISVSGLHVTDGSKPGDIVVRRLARVSFQAGRVMVLNMDLVTACADKFQGCENEDKTCVAGGCVDPGDAELHPWEGETPRTLPDGGQWPPDASQNPGDITDAASMSMDGRDGRDGATPNPPDAGEPDAEVLPEGDFPEQLALGEHFSCVRMRFGKVYCWGLNHAGQLGEEVAVGGMCGGRDCSASPLQVAGSDDMKDLAAGITRVCAVNGSNELKCWGAGSSALKSVRDAANQVVMDAKQVSVGLDDHACYLNVDNQALCWGDNSYGQAGNQMTSAVLATPVRVTAYDANLKVEQIVAGGSHTCVVAGGNVLCWGENTYAACGVAPEAEGAQLTANRMPLMGAPQTVAAGRWHNCAVVDGHLECWGNNEYGELGHLESMRDCYFMRLCSWAPRAITQPFMEANAKMFTGGDEFSCALCAEGQVLCWGQNNWGQLGGSTLAETSVPSPVALTDAKQVMAGATHACALVGKQRDIYCWGSNEAGELGPNGTVGTKSGTPLAVPLPLTP